MSDQLVAETSTWQHTTLPTKVHSPSGIRTHNLSRRAAADLRPRGHRDRQNQRVVMCKYWNKAASPLKLSLPAFADSFSLLELFRLPVGNKSLIDNKILHKKGFTFWTFFLRTKHISTWVDTLTVNTTVYALHENPLSSPIVSKRSVGPLFFEETTTAENYPDLFNQFIGLLKQNKWDG